MGLNYINTSEIPSELSRENFISSHVKIKFISTRGHVISSIYVSFGARGIGTNEASARVLKKNLF